jgi:hypothetical protein
VFPISSAIDTEGEEGAPCKIMAENAHIAGHTAATPPTLHINLALQAPMLTRCGDVATLSDRFPACLQAA